MLPAIEVGNSIPGRRVVAVLERLAKTRGLHRIITTDNRTEFTSRAVDEWAQTRSYICAGPARGIGRLPANGV